MATRRRVRSLGRRLGLDALAGLVVGLVEAVLATSIGGLIYAGLGTEGIDRGVGFALAGGAVSLAWIGWRSGTTGTMGALQATVAAVTAAVALERWALYTGGARTASVIAATDSIVECLTEESLVAMERDDPDLAASTHRAIVVLLSERLARANDAVRALVE